MIPHFGIFLVQVSYLESIVMFYIKDDKHQNGISVGGSGRPVTVKSEWYGRFLYPPMAPFHFASLFSPVQLYVRCQDPWSTCVKTET